MRLLFTFLFLPLLFLFKSGQSKATALPVDPADSVKKHAKVHADMVFPNPANVNKLFYVQRDPNTNTIIYELNTDKDGALDSDNPVHVYWIKYNERGQREELNYLQRKFAYGLNFKALKDDVYDIRFVSYKKLPLRLMKAADGKYHIFVTIAEKQAILSRIFIKIEGGTFWFPNIVYVELKGTDPATGKEIMERFKP